MGIEKLTILGLSEPTLTMIFDNLESCRLFPEIKIVNNLGLNELKPFENLEFTIDIVKDISSNNDKSGFFLGVIKPYTKLAVFNNYSEQNGCRTSL